MVMFFLNRIDHPISLEMYTNFTDIAKSVNRCSLFMKTLILDLLVILFMFSFVSNLFLLTLVLLVMLNVINKGGL